MLPEQARLNFCTHYFSIQKPLMRVAFQSPLLVNPVSQIIRAQCNGRCPQRDTGGFFATTVRAVRSCATFALSNALDEAMIREALKEARKAFAIGEVPIGAVLTDDRGRIISTGYNQVEALKDCTQHAELVCLRRSMKILGSWRLYNTTLYSTVEPCPMCLSALALARVSRIVYGAPDLRLGACGSWVDLSSQKHPYHSFRDVTSNVLEEECGALLRQFFQQRRTEQMILKK